MLYYCTFDTPLGACAVGCSPSGVAFALSPVKTGTDLDTDLSEALAKLGTTSADTDGVGFSCEVESDAPEVAEAASLLQRFYQGKSDLQLLTYPLDYQIIRPSPFQRSVWDTVRQSLAWGAIASYHDIAAIIGKPGAARAVGNAMATCSAPGFVPCQRVVGSNGKHFVLGGYGSSLELKRALLKAEGIEL